MGATMGRRSLLKAGAVLAGSSAVGIGGSTTASAQPRRGKTAVSAGFVIGRPTVNEDGGAVRVGLPMLSRGSNIVAYTQPVTAAVADVIAGSVREGALVDFLVSGDEVVVAAEPGETFHTALTKGAQPVFVTRKYGPELARRDDKPGAMVAAGWVYAKGRNTITVGDGRVVTEDISGRALPQPVKRYEETYELAENVEVYAVNTQDWSASAPSSLQAMPVTRDYSYRTTKRQAAFVVFDRDFRSAAKARVRQIFYFTPQDVSDGKPVWDVPTQSNLLADKGIDPVSGLSYIDIEATAVAAAPYTRSTEPFEIVPGALYCVGDNEVSLFLFRCDDGRLVLVDTGWPNSGYQYWKNIEAVGIDPRDIDCVLLPQGHLNAYGTTVELVTMIENAGGKVELLAPREDVLGIQADAGANSWKPPVDLSGDQQFLRARTKYFDFDRWLNFGNVRIRPLWTPDRTAGTSAFVFEVGYKGKRLTFGYMGGYGWNTNTTVTPANGWRRLGFVYNQAWLQQTVDVDFITGQHASQYPVVEVYQTLKVYNNDPTNQGRQLTMLDAMTRDRWIDSPEKRCHVASRSIEPIGPFEPEPEAGASSLRVKLLDKGQVFQGVKRGQHVDTRPSLQKEGIVIAVDSFVHDPEGWYAQFALTGVDDQGSFLPEAGPVELIQPEVTEILRTQRFNSRAEAEAVTRGVQAGQTYRIDLTLASAIAVPVDGSPVFRVDN